MANTSFATGILSANFTSSSSDPKVGLGTRADANKGGEFIYCRANGAITGAGYVVSIDPTTWDAVMLSTSNDARGNILGVAAAAAVDDDYIWVQRAGPCSVQVAASCAANAALNSTATAGQIDDDATTGAFSITGMVLTTARGGTAGTAAAILNYPQEGAVL